MNENQTVFSEFLQNNIEQMIIGINIIKELLTAYKKKENVNSNKLKINSLNSNNNSSFTKIIKTLTAIFRNVSHTSNLKAKSKPTNEVAVIAVMFKPYKCPRINSNICTCCQGQSDSVFEYFIQSYMRSKPTSVKVIHARHNPRLHVIRLIKWLQHTAYESGHRFNKVKFNIMGRIFMCLPGNYRDYFIRNLYDALSGHQSRNVEEAIKYAECSRIKCIDITIETRTDYCQHKHLSDMLRYGCTSVQFDVKYLHQEYVYNYEQKLVDAWKSFHLATSIGFKVVISIVPRLPNKSSCKTHISYFNKFALEPNFRIDGLNIYPSLVVSSTDKLYDQRKNGTYKEYSPVLFIHLMTGFLSIIPPWMHLHRVQYNIPVPLIKKSNINSKFKNLCDIVLGRMKCLQFKYHALWQCDIKMQEIYDKEEPRQVDLVRRDYVAHEGWETFLSYEDKDNNILIGLLRLRKNNEIVYRPELKDESSIIRELFVYDSEVANINITHNSMKFLPHNYDILLMKEAERIAKEEHLSKKIVVISGIGKGNYYKKLGYKFDGPYMFKMLV